MKKLALLVAIGVVLVAAEAETFKAMYKVSRLSPTEVGISCLNGGDPTGKKFGTVLVLSCGE